MFRERFNYKTNRLTPRRWFPVPNPAPARAITRAIGNAWITDLTELHKLKPLAGDRGFVEAVRKAKREAKGQFAAWLESTAGHTIDPETMFESQIKRIHQYKRQLPNTLRINVPSNALKANSAKMA